MKKATIKVDEWNRPFTDSKNAYIYPETKTTLMLNANLITPSYKNMDDDKKEKINKLMKFNVTRRLFHSNIQIIVNYIDYFIEFYDNEKTLPIIYLTIKNMIDNDELTPSEFFKILMIKFFNETNMKKLIYKMINENYDMDITIMDGEKNQQGRKFNKPNDFTNDDAKALLSASLLMKIIVPLVNHYIDLHADKLDDADKFHMKIFTECFLRMITNKKKKKNTNGQYDSEKEIDLLKKLYIFAADKIEKHYKVNSLMWNQQSALRGVTKDSHLDNILTKYIISDNFFKINTTGNITHFIKSIINTQLLYTINKLKYKKDPVRIDDIVDANGLSSRDKAYQQLIKRDETRVTMAEVSTQQILTKLLKKYGKVTKEEQEYYKKNFPLTQVFQNSLLENNYAKQFMGYGELKNITDRQRILLICLMKRQLKKQGYIELPWLLTSVEIGKTTSRVIKNTKFTNKLINTERYASLEKSYVSLMGFNNNNNKDSKEKNPIISSLSYILNNKFAYVEYDTPELTGVEIEFHPDIIMNEMLSFIEDI